MFSTATSLFRNLADKLPFGITIYELVSREDMDFKIVYANEIVSKMTGIDFEQLIGNTTRTVLASAYEGNAATPTAMLEALDTKQEVSLGVATYVDEKGGPITGENTCIFVEDNHVAILAKTVEKASSLSQRLPDESLIVMTSDITESRERELELQELHEQLAATTEDLRISNEGLRYFSNHLQEKSDPLQQALHFQEKIMDTSPEIIYVYDLIERQNVFSNKSLFEELGYSEADVQAMGDQFFPQTIHPEDLALVFHHHGQILPNLQEKQTATLSYRMLHQQTKEYIWLESTESVFENDEQGNVRTIVGIARNINEQKKAEEKLQQALHFQEKIFDTSPSVIFIYDLKQGRVTYTNKPINSLMGYTQEDIHNFGEEIREKTVFPEDLPKITHHYTHVLPHLTEGEKVSIVRRSIKKDKSVIWLSTVQSVFERDEEGHPHTIISVVTDITPQKLVEAQLSEANKELEQFVYSVSHDLRAPVRHIESYADRVKEDESSNLTEEGQIDLGRVIHSAKRLGSMIDVLLDYSRNRNAKPSKSWVNSKQLVSSILLEFKTSHTQQVISWKLEDLPTCYADPYMMRLIWENLISNAVKYSSKKKETHIQVQAEEKEDEIIYAIHDNGAGFDQTYADKLFSIFQRLHKRREFPGHGIGLANVARMIQHHQGRIWGESTLGEGASFYFSIPKPNGDE